MLRLLILCAVFSIVACAGNRSVGTPEKTNDVMITFVQRAQAGFWKEAMENVTPDESGEMMEGGQVLQEYKDAVNRIRLSTIKNMDLSLDKKGRLVGLKDILDEFNGLYIASEEKVVIDPSKLEDLAARRQKEEEEAAKREKEAPPKEEKSTWLDVYYGNSKEGGSTREDGNSKEAQEEGEDGEVKQAKEEPPVKEGRTRRSRFNR